MKNIYLLTIAVLLSCLGLTAQTPCPNLVPFGDFEGATTGFTFGYPVNAACVINTYNISTNLNTKCSNWGSLGDRTNPGTGKFLIVQGSTAVNVWSANVTVTPNTPYVFSFWATGTIPYSTVLSAVVNGGALTPNVTTSITPGWVKYTFTGTTPSVLTSIPIAIKQVSFGEAYDFGIDDIVFTSCPEPPCPSCSGVSGANLVTNGSFTNGNVGFTSQLSGPSTCGAGNYGIVANFTNFCAGWGPLAAHSAPNFLAIDGKDNGASPTVLWQTPVTLTTNTVYNFSFWWALGFAHPSQNFPVSIDIVDAAGVPITGASNLGQPTIATNLTWTNTCLTWNSGTIPNGSYFIAIRQLSGSAYRDWGIDDICFTKAPPPPCTAAFTFQNINNCGNVQFTNTSVPTTGLTYAWNFGDPSSGANNTSALPNPTHQFSTCGTYNVCLIIAGPTCKDTICQTVTVTDNTPPVARCKPGVGVILNPTTCQYLVTTAFVDNGTTDDCQLKTLVINPAILFGCGNTTVTLTATDWCGNRSTCTMGIQTTETIPPVIVCPPNTSVTCTTDTLPSVTGFATATDNCPGTVKITRSDAVSGVLPCDGSIRRTWTATDSCGNTASCVQTILVRDNVPPIITSCPPSKTVGTNAGQCYYTFSPLPTITATDNCDPTPSVSCTWTDPNGVTLPLTATSQLPKGVNTIKCTAKDKCNNLSRECVFTVTVVDNQPPTITCPQSLTVVGTLTPPPSPLCKAIVNGLAPTATDNCPMLGVNWQLSGSTLGQGISDASGTNFMQGTTTVTYTALDMGGNTATCNFTVTVSCDTSAACACNCAAGSVTGPNLVTNGNFSAGDVSFGSDFPSFCNSCVAARRCVGPNFASKCAIWSSTFGDHTTSTGQFLIIDGSETTSANAWATTVSVVAGTTYSFSFWAASIYPDPFTLGLTINNATVPVSTFTVNQPTTAWTSYCTTWVSNITGPVTIAIRQLTGGVNRDFGLDDICFRKCSQTCSAEIGIVANGCGRFTFNGLANGTAPFTYAWNFGDPLSGVNNTATGTSATNALPPQLHKFIGSGLHTVTLNITDATNCTSSFTATITSPVLPTASITGNLSVCSGQSTTLTASGGGSYSWLPSGQITPSINVTPTINANTYSVIVTDANGCKDTATVTVSIKPIPAFILQNQAVCQGQNATLTASGGGTYLWSPGGQTTASITVTPSVTTTYSCAVTTNGCTGSASATVNVIICGCPNNIVQNGTFITGLTAGNLGFGGTAPPWTKAYNTPQVDINDGFVTNGSIQMWGNQAFGEGIQQPITVQVGCTYKLDFNAKYLVLNDSFGLFVPKVRFRANPASYITLGTGTLIGISQPLTTAWLPYSMTWTPSSAAAVLNITPWNNNTSVIAAQTSWIKIDDICITKQGCPATDTCGVFSTLAFGYEKGPTKPVTCGNTSPVVLQCPNAAQRFYFTGQFNCIGTSTTAPINWEIWRNNGTTYVPTGTIGSVTAVSGFFNIPLFASYFTAGGVYELRMTGLCGNQKCSCAVRFEIPPCPDSCPCDAASIKKDVGSGFYQTLWSRHCKACFTPIALRECDRVEWSITPVDTSFSNPADVTTGNKPFCFSFATAGTYTITMRVIRQKPDGTTCEGSFSKRVVIKCGVVSTGCDNQVFLNPEFGTGAVVGTLGTAGRSRDWVKVTGNPTVKDISETGGDGWSMQLSGNDDTYDAIRTDAAYCLEKDTGTITLRAKLGPVFIEKKPMIFVNLVRGDGATTSPCLGGDCNEVACLEMPEDADDWVEFQFDYDLRGLTASDTCSRSTVPRVKLRPVIYVGNSFRSEQGGISSYSTVLIDNFCLKGKGVVPVNSPKAETAIRLFPNPNRGSFTLELSEAATPKMSYRITDLLGRILVEKAIEIGNVQQTVQTSDLSNGLYFIQLLNEGKKVAEKKFVKQ